MFLKDYEKLEERLSISVINLFLFIKKRLIINFYYIYIQNNECEELEVQKSELLEENNLLNRKLLVKDGLNKQISESEERLVY